MITLISPAKKLDETRVQNPIAPTEPALFNQTKILARAAKTKSADDLKKLMNISDDLATLNADRYRSFRLNGRSNSAKPAALTFNGDVYLGLDAKSLTKAQMKYAQDHLRILSGLYGILKPMDIIQPYRLEMGVRMENPRGKNLYEFWGNRISKSIMADLADDKTKAVVNLASNEYFKAVDKKTLTVPVITPSFLNVKDGKARALMFFGKRARGLMARWIIENKVENIEDLNEFQAEGYKFNKKLSEGHKLVFTRKQPPPVNG
ncbi:MAG: peroxide stress protein YaaA [Hyphomonadaceae bacterium]|nr:peroxide stress protein YaaA [Hyphomonadaceae bacterium]